MEHVTGSQVWDQIMKDPEFNSQGQPVTNAAKPFIEALPEILKDYLDKKVTMKTLLQAKVAFLRYCLANGFFEAVIPAQQIKVTSTAYVKNQRGGKLEVTKEIEVPSSSFFGNTEISMMKGVVAQLVDQLEEAIPNIPALLTAAGYLSEKEAFQSPKSGMSPSTFQIYDQDQLTFDKLLRVQPMAIVKNS